jgi:hypothetical protein
MKQLFTRPSKFADWLVALVLVLVPFHAFLTVWGSALVGHYTLLRGWDDVVLLVLFGVSCYWLARDNGLRKWFMGSLLVRLVLAYALLNLLLGFVSLAKGDVVFRALAYGWLLDLRFLAWFLAVLLAAQRSSFLGRAWPKLLLVPAGLVVAFATLQYVALPHDFLAHFGYHANSTIAPIETINHNNHYIRVQSTLRGANPLGAYLVLVLSALGVFWACGECGLWAGSTVCALCQWVAQRVDWRCSEPRRTGLVATEDFARPPDFWRRGFGCGCCGGYRVPATA